jgi:hypothetical protein
VGAGGVTGAGDRDGAASGGWSRASSAIAAKREGRGGGGDLGVQCGNDEGQKKKSHLMRAFFFFSMTVAVARHPDRTDGCVLSLSLNIAWCLTYIAVAFRDRPFLSTMPSCSLSITDSSIGGSRWRSADQCYCASTCGLTRSDLCS